MTSFFDVIIVGARCAGSPLALMLARRGLNVCVVDKAEFPSDTPSTHAIAPNGVRVLQRLGLADAVSAMTDPITRMRLAFDDMRVESGDITRSAGAPMLNVRRIMLDEFLVDQARTAGATVLTSTAVTGLTSNATGRVNGVETTSGDLRAGLVIGADGTKSTVARLAGARDYLSVDVPRVFQWRYFAEATAPRDTLWVGRIGAAGYLGSPTDSGLFMVTVTHDRATWRDASKTSDATFTEDICRWPELADVLPSARQVGKHNVMTRGRNYFRMSAGSGWVLVGDAGHFKDPTPGQGIADALRQTEQLAPAIERALAGHGDRPLVDWWRWRDRDAMDMYWLAQMLGAPGPIPPLLLGMLAELTATGDGVERFVRMMDHSLASTRVMHPGLLFRGLAHGWNSNQGDRGQLLRDALTLTGQRLRQQSSSLRARRITKATTLHDPHRAPRTEDAGRDHPRALLGAADV
ncbi:NAD(P)/FAD-dependent oxidoreductase [Mycolicibacterium sp. CBMA 226]|uniref:NAD(P)/FAD-dependent oxidoreductase n=1 Tax=Mycolicibacterium sp. CBMA 226 TaxID=2606611 RepID=UPI0012DBE105|nr:NAD(P)/FAD-dependent oxidoreductase [Mycolicibacterium sp. CBMA 226]MUL78812.1 FAD-dependent monooxygenase [Mycolicibacterium sp. CBMA 226]QGW61107.1 Aklavinone 12-hydroxylase RdmE [Mycolicibacterium sp.]